MDKIKILVISVAAISDEESNGRVLKTLLPISEPCQFLNIHISGQPTSNTLIDYLCFTDKCALKSLISFSLLSNPSDNCFFSESKNSQLSNDSKKKKPISYLLRNVVWKLAFGIKNKIIKNAKMFNPNIVYLMGANMPFLFKMARLISKKTHSSLIIYNAEDYPLKKYDYITGKSSYSLITKIVQRGLFREAKRAYKSSKFNIFNSDKLLNSYIKEKFVGIENSTVIRIPSTLTSVTHKKKNNYILYAGNLYDDRCRSLLEFADALISIKSEFKLVVYGRLTDKNLLKKIESNSAILYKGIVSFSELKNRFSDFSFLLHIDGFSDYSKLDYKHAFSTKIADYLILGIPFISYGSIEIAGIEFLYKLNKDFTIISKDELTVKIKKILNHEVEYKQDRTTILKEFSMYECRNKMLDLFKRFESNNKI